MERGEVDGMGSASEEYLLDRGWFTQKLVNIIYTVGEVRRASAGDAPTVVELMQNDRDRNVMRLIAGETEIGRAFVAPPGIPTTAAAALRTGFAKMLQDPDFLADAKQRNILVEPLAAEALGRTVTAAMAMPDDVMTETRAILR